MKEEQESALEQLQSMMQSVETKISRSKDRDCDFCGKSEGSVTVDDYGVARCRTCFNNPDKWPDEDEDPATFAEKHG